MISSGSSFAKPLSLVPFFYFLVTRISGLRDLAYLAASSLLPGLWLVWRLGEYGPIEAIVRFALGYLAFIAIYELGYFLNDAWDARRRPSGRQRIPFVWGVVYAATFVALRLVAWPAIGWATGWLWSPLWLAAFGALILAFGQHNVISAAALRSATFVQLSTLRFVIPVLPSIAPESVAAVIAAALLFYTYFRFLSYLESKDLLQMPDRRAGSFQLLQTLMLTPLILFLAYTSGLAVIFELWVYFVVIFGLWAALSSRGRGGDPTP
jgi:hypothetical protein